jgi:hypothetical protein
MSLREQVYRTVRAWGKREASYLALSNGRKINTAEVASQIGPCFGYEAADEISEISEPLRPI